MSRTPQRRSAPVIPLRPRRRPTRTRLEGTTWYTNRMWPSAYWKLWSDEVIHRIHLRVLDHIRERSEARA